MILPVAVAFSLLAVGASATGESKVCVQTVATLSANLLAADLSEKSQVFPGFTWPPLSHQLLKASTSRVVYENIFKTGKILKDFLSNYGRLKIKGRKLLEIEEKVVELYRRNLFSPRDLTQAALIIVAVDTLRREFGFEIGKEDAMALALLYPLIDNVLDEPATAKTFGTSPERITGIVDEILTNEPKISHPNYYESILLSLGAKLFDGVSESEQSFRRTSLAQLFTAQVNSTKPKTSTQEQLTTSLLQGGLCMIVCSAFSVGEVITIENAEFLSTMGALIQMIDDVTDRYIDRASHATSPNFLQSLFIAEDKFVRKELNQTNPTNERLKLISIHRTVFRNLILLLAASDQQMAQQLKSLHEQGFSTSLIDMRWTVWASRLGMPFRSREDPNSLLINLMSLGI